MKDILCQNKVQKSNLLSIFNRYYHNGFMRSVVTDIQIRFIYADMGLKRVLALTGDVLIFQNAQMSKLKRHLGNRANTSQIAVKSCKYQLRNKY